MFAALLLPGFRLQAALRFQLPAMTAAPVALLGEKDHGKSPVDQVSPAALRAGVAPGMSASQAQARCPELILQLRAPRQEAIAASILRECASSVSPYLEMTGEGLCTLDLRGRAMEADHRHWARPLIAQLAALGLRAQVGVAPNPELAHQAARLAAPFRQVDSANAFDELPLDALDPPPETAGILAAWGIRTLSQLASLPRQDVGERLGNEGLALWDRAAGRSTRPVLDLWHPRETYEEVVELEYGMETLEPLLFILRRMIGQLALRLANAYFVAAEIKLTLRCDNTQCVECACAIPSPTRDADTLFRLLYHYLENVRTAAPIIALELWARPGAPAPHQFALFQASLRNPNAFFETLARLAALVGQDRVGTPRPESTYRPDAFRMASPRFMEEPPPVTNPGRIGPALRRFRPPIPARVCVKDGYPAFVDSSEIRGSIARAAGPWRVSGDWWESGAAWAYDEWDIEMAPGKLYRLAMVNTQDWTLMGKYD